jgi:hypothetical protein
MLNNSIFRRRGVGFGYRRDASEQTTIARTETASEVTKIYRPVYWLVDFFFPYEAAWIVARLVLPLVSFGRICVEPLTYPSPPHRFNMFGYRRDERGRLELEKRAASLMSVVILAFALCVGNWLIRTAG